MRLKKTKASLKEFLVKSLGVAEKDIEKVILEDVYTPIDRCLADGLSLRTNSPAELQVIREQMEYLLSIAIDEAFKATSEVKKQYVTDFAKYIVNRAAIRAEKAKGAKSADEAKRHDVVSVISLNWDILFDSRIYNALKVKDGGTHGDYEAIGVVDYCCYISSIEPDNKRIRSALWALGARGYNVKLLKLHGSMNWLQCTNCQRLFVGFDQKLNISDYIERENCRHCMKRGIPARFMGSLVMPTFLKDLSNFQIKLVWQNASVELMEAHKVIFIGYSLPHADFEFRQLMSRMLHKDAKIEVVLYQGKTAESKLRYRNECDRFQEFFTSRKIRFWPDGVEDFVKETTA